jgi:hypothetical protein
MIRERTFRIAVRRFAPFESAIRKQWDAFESVMRTGLHLEAEPFDLPELTSTLFAQRGLLRGDWDLAFINTDWVASAHASRSVLDLGLFLKQDPLDDYPNAWTASLLRLQNIGGFVVGLPYHHGPECLIFRKDLFADPREQNAYQERFGAVASASHLARVSSDGAFFSGPNRAYMAPLSPRTRMDTIPCMTFFCNSGPGAANSSILQEIFSSILMPLAGLLHFTD